MEAPDRPQPSSRLSALAELLRETFWILVLGLIACYGFFVALGAFAPADVAGVSIAVAVLLALWLLHVWARKRRERDAARDPRLTAARERRGF